MPCSCEGHCLMPFGKSSYAILSLLSLHENSDRLVCPGYEVGVRMTTFLPLLHVRLQWMGTDAFVSFVLIGLSYSSEYCFLSCWYVFMYLASSESLGHVCQSWRLYLKAPVP